MILIVYVQFDWAASAQLRLYVSVLSGEHFDLGS
jgi:hypothetical protein